MITVNIICIGSMKSEFKGLCSEYEKRLGKYCRLKVIELPESKLSDNPSAMEIDKALFMESQNILKTASDYVALDSHGKMFTSEEFANFIKSYIDRGQELNFVIGSSYGLHDHVKQKSKSMISFSKFTFPHQLMRIILLEQIYRGMCIINNKTYHK